MNTKKKIARLLLNIPFVRNAVREKADLSAFTIKPDKKTFIRNIFGLFLILLSYAICWPVVLVLGIISVYLGKPLIVLIGGPAAYGISHLMFLAGMYITGARYTFIFLRWAARKGVEKLAGSDGIVLSGKDACD